MKFFVPLFLLAVLPPQVWAGAPANKPCEEQVLSLIENSARIEYMIPETTRMTLILDEVLVPQSPNRYREYGVSASFVDKEGKNQTLNFEVTVEPLGANDCVIAAVASTDH